MSKKRLSRAPKRTTINVVLDQQTIDDIDVVAEEVEETRSYVIEEMLKYCLQESVLDELFPPEEDGDQEEEGQGEQ